MIEYVDSFDTIKIPDEYLRDLILKHPEIVLKVREIMKVGGIFKN